MEIEIKKIDNGWIVTISGVEIELVHDGKIPIEHFEPDFLKVLDYLRTQNLG